MYKDAEVRQFVSRETSALWGGSRVVTGCDGDHRPNSRPLISQEGLCPRREHTTG